MHVSTAIEEELAELLAEACRDGVAPGAALVVGDGAATLAECYAGRLEPGGPEVAASTFFDLASLTKPLASVAVALQMVAEGRLALDRPVAELLPAFAGAGPDAVPRREVRVVHLLEHSSGLPAHRRYHEIRDIHRRGLVAAALAEPLEAAPGKRSVYSDIGFLVLGAVLEAAAGEPLEDLLRARVLDVPGEQEVDFGGPGTRLAGLAAHAAAAGRDHEGRVLRGIVNDENARAMGGVAPHAGLFGTAPGVHRLAAAWVAAWRGEPGGLPIDGVREAWTHRARTEEPSTWALGWDTPSAEGSSTGALIGRPAVGHLGFTGTSLWIDLERGIHVVLLTNRVHADAGLEAIRALRPRVHDTVFRAFDEGRFETD